MLCRKERWGLSRRGWLVLALLSLSLGFLVLLRVHPFLSVTERVDSKFLAVEGWIHQYAIAACTEEFRAGNYQRVFSTGGPAVGSGGYVDDANTTAGRGATLLRKAGVPAQVVQMVPSRVSARDRTYSAAVALRDWFHDHDMTVRSINVVTEDAHARRTRLLFQEALGENVQVGIISVPNPDYDAKHWWRYSEGVREVLGESIAYIYAKIFFSAPAKAELQNR